MAGEDVSESPTGGGDSLEGWLDSKADELGVSRDELLAQLRNGNGDIPSTDADGNTAEDAPNGNTSNGNVPDGDAPASDTPNEDAAGDAPEEIETPAEFDALRGEFDEKIQDVRERVIQVKRETDEKAPADHAHPELAPAAVANRADELAGELESLSETVAELDETVETGFENYEDVLEYLTDATDDIEAKLTTLAEATVDLRDQTEMLSARHATRAAADELAHLANRRGVESAKCGHCGKTVHVGLLASPKCPHCASTFNDVERKQSFFGSHTLVVGDPPALEGERADWDIDRVMDDDAADHSKALDDLLEGGDD